LLYPSQTLELSLSWTKRRSPLISLSVSTASGHINLDAALFREVREFIRDQPVSHAPQSSSWVDRYPHGIELRASLCGFGAHRKALDQGAQFADAGVVLV
jgi:hypothetical protein